MSEKTNPTVKQHYISQFYLRGFSDDEIYIYRYDIQDKKNVKQVPINSICYEKNLYEFKNTDGEYIERNIVEDRLAILEGKISEVINEIDRNSTEPRNYMTGSFLSKEQKAFLISFATIQILRVPEIIKLVSEEISREFNVESEDISNNYAISTCLPIFKTLNPEEKSVFWGVMEWFNDMTFAIGVTNSEPFVTSDRPCCLIMHPEKEKLEKFIPDEIVFPLSSKLILLMHPYNDDNIKKRNRLVKLPIDYVRRYNKRIIDGGCRYIYSKDELTKEEMKWFEKRCKNHELLQHSRSNK